MRTIMEKRQPQTAEPFLEVRDMMRRFVVFQTVSDVDVSVFVKKRWVSQVPLKRRD